MDWLLVWPLSLIEPLTHPLLYGVFSVIQDAPEAQLFDLISVEEGRLLSAIVVVLLPPVFSTVLKLESLVFTPTGTRPEPHAVHVPPIAEATCAAVVREVDI